MRATKDEAERASAAKRGRWSWRERARLRELYGLREEAAIARELKRPVSGVLRMVEELFPPGRSTGAWTAREALELKRYLGASSTEVIARILGRSVAEIDARILELDRIRRTEHWTRREISEFKRLYGTRSDENLSRIFARSLEEVRRLAREHRLSKDKAFVCKQSGAASTRMPHWRPEELALLQQEYPGLSNLELARQLGRSVKSVVSKAHQLGLKKASGRLRQMGRENIRLRYQTT